MHLLDLLAARARPAAALHMALTRRCPLSCAHCSTASTMDAEQLDAALLEEFVATFTPGDRPDFLLLTGGEPLLRPGLVRRLALRARAAGCRTQVTSGMFFAARGGVPGPVARALDAVDHVAASVDAFHEREVPRGAVLRVLRGLLDAGKDLSVQVTGFAADDPYLREVTDDIRRELEDRVPVLVTLVRPAGRARELLSGTGGDAAPAAPGHSLPDPCSMAAWPVVAFDGTVVACCNQDVVDGRGGGPPAHLTLGHIATDDWATVRERQLGRPVLRGIRAFGPVHLAGGAARGRGPCDTCVHALAAGPVAEEAEASLRRPRTRAMERALGQLVEAGGAEAFLRRHVTERYRPLAHLGAPPARVPGAPGVPEAQGGAR
ncbi:hypothetical protein GCM10009801_49460 [Streptomyces albiaxialis]|uniref:Radical SAM core domain-containing protein n=1 Tax=Streptomyces albiaxialis TaxID=329523 RepID=A0ABN2W9G3_9ACTN